MLQWSVSGGSGECGLPGGGGTRNWQCSSSSFQLTMRNRSWFLSKMDARNFSSALSPDTDIFPSSPAGGVRKGSRGREPPSRPRPPRGAGPGRALAAPPLPAAATRVRARLEKWRGARGLWGRAGGRAGGRASERAGAGLAAAFVTDSTRRRRWPRGLKGQQRRRPRRRLREGCPRLFDT